MTTPADDARAMRQRADLTFKQNLQHGRHGWLRLTPAYSVRVVDQILSEFGAKAKRVFEPFSGTGTTALCAAYRGLEAVATDINPFLIWLGRVKSAQYSQADLDSFERLTAKMAARLREGSSTEAALPALKNIERWWRADELAFISALKSELDRVQKGPGKDLLEVAFCRTMIGLSNAAFNHQSMSFKPPELHERRARGSARKRFVAHFLSDCETVKAACLDNPKGAVTIRHADSRGGRGKGPREAKFDLLITSPPYPNRMSYIRELRPYMYWLGFLQDGKQAGELDWQAIGGTWGSATSRLQTWQASDAFIPPYLFPIIEKIRRSHPKNGQLMATYVQKYFDDMFQHFAAAALLMKKRGTVHYIVGNSSFYGHLVPAEQLYVDQLTRAGFRNANARALRKRNSKKELLEFHVIAER